MNKQPCMVWLPVDHRKLGEDGHQMPYLVLGDKYARAVIDSVQAQPVLFPLAGSAQIASLIGLVDGVFLTGSPSNVHPSHFGQGVANPALPLDPQRDGLTLALVRACLDQAVPLLGVCRGFQEINVALGGSLHQAVHAVPGKRDHREPEGTALEVQYGPAHAVRLRPGSEFALWAGGERAMATRCTARAWIVWRAACRWKPRVTTGWWRRSRCKARVVLPAPCSGIRSGAAPTIRFMPPCSRLLAKRAANGSSNDWRSVPDGATRKN